MYFPLFIEVSIIGAVSILLGSIIGAFVLSAEKRSFEYDTAFVDFLTAGLIHVILLKFEHRKPEIAKLIFGKENVVIP